MLLNFTMSLPTQSNDVCLFVFLPSPTSAMSHLHWQNLLSPGTGAIGPFFWIFIRSWPFITSSQSPAFFCVLLPQISSCLYYFIRTITGNPPTPNWYFRVWGLTLKLILPSSAILNSSRNFMRYKDILTYKVDSF